MLLRRCVFHIKFWDFTDIWCRSSGSCWNTEGNCVTKVITYDMKSKHLSKLNAEVPGHLAALSKRLGFTLVYISTGMHEFILSSVSETHCTWCRLRFRRHFATIYALIHNKPGQPLRKVEEGRRSCCSGCWWSEGDCLQSPCSVSLLHTNHQPDSYLEVMKIWPRTQKFGHCHQYPTRCCSRPIWEDLYYGPLCDSLSHQCRRYCKFLCPTDRLEFPFDFAVIL